MATQIRGGRQGDLVVRCAVTSLAPTNAEAETWEKRRATKIRIEKQKKI
jgi:hypothetical protein